MAINIGWSNIVSALLFVIGMVGVLTRRNIIIVLLCLELMLNAVNLNFIAFSDYVGNTQGQIFVIFNIAIAAAEAVVGLALVLTFYRNQGKINIDDLNLLKW